MGGIFYSYVVVYRLTVAFYIGGPMPVNPKLSSSSTLILQAIAGDYRYGFDIMDLTGLPSGTVYPALRRLEEGGLIRSRWEDRRSAHQEQRPARRYYEITRPGRKALAEAVLKYRLVGQMVPLMKSKPRSSDA